MMNRRRIPLTTDGQKHYLKHKEEIDRAIADVLNSGEYTLGPEVEALEREFADYCGVKYAVTVNSGTTALLLPLLAREVGEGDEVLAVSNADVAMSTVPLFVGADLNWVDIEEDTFNMSAVDLAEKVSSRTRVVIVAHMYGLPADMAGIRAVLADYPDVILIEDAALAPGAEYGGQKVGSLADFGCFSLAWNKVLGMIGRGGIITTDSPEDYLRLREVRHYGKEKTLDDSLAKPEQHLVRLGLNERLDAIQGAAGRVKLRHLDADLELRRAAASIYNRVLSDSPCRTPRVPENCTHSYRVYVIQVDPSIRDAFVDQMMKASVEVGKHYVPPDHLHPYFLERGSAPGLLPITERVAERLVCLPSHPYMDVADVWYAANTAREVLAELV